MNSEYSTPIIPPLNLKSDDTPNIVKFSHLRKKTTDNESHKLKILLNQHSSTKNLNFIHVAHSNSSISLHKPRRTSKSTRKGKSKEKHNLFEEVIKAQK